VTRAATAAAIVAPADAAQVLAAWDETPALRAIRAQLPPDLAADHRAPGQVVKLHVEGREAYFALASAPSREGVVDLLLKRGSQVAAAVIADATPGAALGLSAPFGRGFPVEEAHGRDVLLFAAGSGIAPIRALVQHVVRHRADFDRVTLYYGQRGPDDFAYAAEHLAWERRGVRVVLCASAAGAAWRGARGRVQDVARATRFGGSSPERSAIFACGMKAMVDEVRAALAEACVPPARVHLNW
jgi:NAD(P)H-flavin reductase